MATIQAMILIFCRIMAFVVLCPIFSQQNFPSLAKIVIGTALTILCLPSTAAITVVLAFCYCCAERSLVRDGDGVSESTRLYRG